VAYLHLLVLVLQLLLLLLEVVTLLIQLLKGTDAAAAAMGCLPAYHLMTPMYDNHQGSSFFVV
jgi:hypothetical protein